MVLIALVGFGLRCAWYGVLGGLGLDVAWVLPAELLHGVTFSLAWVRLITYTLFGTICGTIYCIGILFLIAPLVALAALLTSSSDENLCTI